MGQKLSKQDAELYRRVDEVLHYLWDPIGSAGEPFARDEYGAYVGRVFSLVKSMAASDEIADVLIEIEEDAMELQPDKSKAEMVAEVLLNWRQKLLGSG